ncbi:hypothetical protein EC968_005866 [Mortierella alpina]|nr:hypothetical protein EC968_005866 [Mortierella alpina]
MGNPAFWELLQRLQVTPKDVDPKDMNEVHVDMLACFFYYITTMDYYITRKVWREKKEEETVEDMQLKRIDRLANCLDAKMAKSFDKGTAVLHIDGHPTIQKQHAHDKRSKVQGDQLTSLDGKVAHVVEICQQSCQGSAPNSASLRKLRKAYYAAQKHWKKTLRIDQATRVALAFSLSQRGWQTCQADKHTWTCLGEADVCVGIVAAERQPELGPLTVATSDSDLLVYRNISVLRQNPRQKSTYSLYVQDEVLLTLNKNRPKLSRGKKAVKRVQVLTPEVWRVLAVVSGNDYDANIKGYGVRKNWAILAELWSRMQPTSEMDLLQAYRREMSSRSTKEGLLTVPEFAHSASVFLHLRQEFQLDASAQTMREDIMNMMRLYGQTVRAYNSAQEGREKSSQARKASARSKGYVRHFRTSGNVYRPKIIKPRSLEPLAATTPIAPGSSKTKKQRQTKRPKERVIKSARWMRDKRDLEVREAEAQAAGTELACVQRALPKSFDSVSVGTVSAMTADICSTMAGLAKLSSDLSIFGMLALQHYIVTIMAQHPSIDEAETRCVAFKPVCKDQSFFPALVKELYRPTTSYNKRATADSRAGIDAARMFLRAYESELAIPLAEMQQHLNHCAPKGFLEFVARQLSDTFRSHVDHYIVILKRRVLQRAPAWSALEASALLQSIDDKTGKSPEYDPVSLLWIMNAALTEDLRISLYPMPGWRDRFVTLSETYLFQALTRPRENAEEAKLVEKYHVLFKPDTTAEVSMDEDESGEVDIFANHRGQFTRQLFLSGRTNFARHGAVGIPTDQSLPSVFDFTTHEYQQAIGAVAGASRHDKSYAESKKYFKETILQDLGSRYPRPPAANVQNQAKSDRKYLLSGTLCTDGYQVKLHAYHLDHPKKNDPSQASTSSSSSSSSSSSVAPNSSSSASTSSATSQATGYRRKVPYIREALKTQDDVQSVFAEQQSYVAGTIDPGLHKPATFMVQDTLDPGHRLIIDVPRGDITFNERLFRSRLERAKMRNQIHEVEQKIVAFRLPEPQPQPAPSLPEHQTATAPEPTAAAADSDLEGSPDSLTSTFSESKTSFECHTRSILSSFAQLRTFHGSDEFKRWIYQQQQGTRAEFGTAVNSILATLQDPIHAKHPCINNEAVVSGRRPMLGIGDGNFAKVRSEADKSGKFRDLLVGEVLGRGVLTYQLDEFRTSATCCECGSTNQTQGRTVVCQGESCGIMKDRDHNAVNNMGKAMVMWTREVAWPEHLERNTVVKVEEDKFRRRARNSIYG